MSRATDAVDAIAAEYRAVNDVGPIEDLVKSGVLACVAAVWGALLARSGLSLREVVAATCVAMVGVVLFGVVGAALHLAVERYRGGDRDE